MRISWSSEATHPDARNVDFAERKGFGHPDTLADATAQTFAADYIEACVQRFGVPLNAWVDKVTLVGASSTVEFGRFVIHSPVRCLLIGKLSRGSGSEIDVQGLFEESVAKVLGEGLGDSDILQYCSYDVFNTAGGGVDHRESFYKPARVGVQLDVQSEDFSNDTVVVVAQSANGLTGDLALRLEQWVRDIDPRIGSDIKAMVFRRQAELDITMAVPLYADRVESRDEYLDIISSICPLLEAKVRDYSGSSARVRLNTRDQDEGAYIAPFGTSLGKGDVGAVGRGNRANGVIQPFGIWSAEAPAGKNPRSHGGAVFSSAATRIAGAAGNAIEAFVEVVIFGRAGDSVAHPSEVIVRSDRQLGHEERVTVEEIVHNQLSFKLLDLGQTHQ